ncbi:bifunctional indole-3-glycerol-phosphate synthase TrpC/phosphoribosylanthranilate isomerase TrpF [Buchnera aphidicola (Takecallis taiwana)]|uniref:bifunctional indole-3-glycerol-phosphate synthase TrpC/phosphoribosylanthranilate isomerase TrpF n=1 Tax=Buchnera aphidicola TaxID=9 RepID=UPI0031B73F2B
MKKNILQDILYDKIEWLKYQKNMQPLKNIKNNIITSKRSFYQSLQTQYPNFILEIKKASPSKGIINTNINIENIVKCYKRHATIISVLTDKKYFSGTFERMHKISTLVKQPILCKDFFIDSYQIYLARYYNADAVLLMLSVLDDSQYTLLANLAHTMKMGILTEINNIVELKRAINLKAQVIGINNRNLRTLNIDINTTYELAPLVPKDKIIISESGFYHNRQIKKLKKIVHGFLIGSSIMKAKNIDLKVNSLLFGKNKVCGLTRPKDANRSQKLGAVYGGLIFIPNSPRNIQDHTAQTIIESTKLKYVGVFQNENIEKVQYLSQKYNLYAIQLHGHENAEYIRVLRKKISCNIQIWKAVCIENNVQKLDFTDINYYLFDNLYGGSGTCFNWEKTKQYNLDKVFLSGGLSHNNCIEASKLHCFGLDFNSKLEKKPGIKDYHKLKILFQKLKLL